MWRLICTFYIAINSVMPAAYAGDEAIALALKNQWAEAYRAAEHSGRTPSPLLDWLYVKSGNSGASFHEIHRFLTQYPHWPDTSRIQYRGEQAMQNEDFGDDYVIRWFQSYAPVSGLGKWIYAKALARSGNNKHLIPTLIKEAWVDGDFTSEDEQAILEEFGPYLTLDDHRARIDRLLWEHKTNTATRLIHVLPVKEQLVAKARSALITRDKKAAYLVGQIKGNDLYQPGLLYERIRYRSKRNDTNGVRQLMYKTPQQVPYPQRWWGLRSYYVRDAVDKGDYKAAAKLLSNHGQVDGASFAEAIWLQGWIDLEFLGNPKDALKSFTRMYENVGYPVSLARAAYWAGRAAKKSGYAQTARDWFAHAARHPTTYYGQLALMEIAPGGTLILPDEPLLTIFAFNDHTPADLKSAITYAIENDHIALAQQLIEHVIDSSPNDNTVLAAAKLGHEMDAPHISVKAAKKALTKGVILKHIGYPLPDTDPRVAIERPLAMAIIRQESEFNPQAISPAGARGLMQLMPRTAREVARKMGKAYHQDGLFETGYNILLGSQYLDRMISSYDGSYVLGIAAYNAGPGNVNKWLKGFGPPGKDLYEIINWIEKMPFSETRNYVQRVIENLQVYRALMGAKRLTIDEDLTRGS